MTTLFVRVDTLLLARRGHRGDRGQTTAECALVLLGVAAIALLVGGLGEILLSSAIGQTYLPLDQGRP